MALLKSLTTCNSSVVSFLYRIQFRSNTFRVLNKMHYVYFHELDDGKEKISVSLKFNYKTSLFSLNKDISLNRNASDTIDVFLNRLKIKLDALIKKKIELKAKKANLTEECLAEEVNVCLTSNGEPLSGATLLRDLVEYKGDVKLNISDQVYKIVVNAPLITNMVLPKVICVGSVCFPVKFEGSSINKGKSAFLWFKAGKLHTNKWTKCGEGFYYIPSDDDINQFLKCKCLPVNNIDEEGPEYEVCSLLPVTTSSGSEEIFKRHEFTAKETAVDEIRIVSYNILADTYVNTKEAKTKLFTYCDPEILNLDYRKNLWNFELLGYKADLICLQEVDLKVFTTNFKPLLESKNMGGVFSEKKGQREGCALFYNLDKFELLKSSQHSYFEEIINNPLLSDIKEKLTNKENLINRLTNIHSQILIAVLKCLKKEKQVVVVVNTHLYFHPDADHIRLLQGIVGFRILLNAVEEVKKLFPDSQVSVILCGDFNSTPECGFHTFLNEGELDSSHPEWKIKKDEEIEGVCCKHTLNMKSAYGAVEFTNYTTLFKACIDYIYFQTDFLELKQIVPIPSEEVLSRNLAIPSKFFPSDHVALIADLKFKNK